MMLKNTLLYLGISILAVMSFLIFLTVYIPTPYYLYAFMGQLPAFLICGVVYYTITKIFTPNPKTSSFMGLVAMESVEHLVLPILLIFSLLTVPLLFYPLLLFTFVVVYGFVIGKIETKTDLIKLSVLCVTLFIALWLPELMLYFSHIYGFSFNSAVVVVCGMSVASLLINNKIYNIKNIR